MRDVPSILFCNWVERSKRDTTERFYFENGAVAIRIDETEIKYLFVSENENVVLQTHGLDVYLMWSLNKMKKMDQSTFIGKYIE